MVDNVPFPSGCYNSTVVDSYVLDNALVQDTFLLHRSASSVSGQLHLTSTCLSVVGTYVSQGAVIVGCGTITCSGPEVTYGNGTVLKVGVEIGGREIAMFADMPFHLAAIVGESRGNAAELKAYEDLVRTYAKSVRCDGFNVIARQAKVLRCPKIRDVFVGDGGVVEDSVVSNSTILSTPAEFSSIVGFSQVHSSILQWNAHVDGGSSVERSFLCDCSHVERHGMVMDSLLGTSSLYGANVGSNHTLKAPDQELWPGEGVFYGLSVSIKYPSNFTNAAYSVIATGVSTLPQKLDMPFALVNIPGHNIPELSPAINEIYPGYDT
ncbi:hypothetical protein DYB32_003852 [Aphanomyces invadans]|uniref:DUF4954 domain-containing protein n=1 Tax=Aphanomyces invadans TaxID=157072 RepID=A0A418AZF3_9STRA|nr:hypothetical protein DYB32_003852 [Aphanomyces invadans]